ncbi:MAG TPA: HlyD family efflux transporter periplasmic adaptor subunit [Thermoanaerobaculia bacterium]|nr:HlyD family efflux transporter periplasmic adaptor subunit [Thermoanaerobaculia bacterium]
MKRKKLMIAVVVLLLAAGAAGAWYWFHRQRQNELVLSGSIEVRTVQVGSLVGGRVAKVLVDEGATVQAGQPLVTLEPDLQDLQIAEQRAVVANAQAALAKMIKGPRSEEVQRARIDWRAAETDRRRLEALWKAGVIGRQDYDAAAAKEATLRQTLAENERGNVKEDIEAARADLARQQEHLAYLERQRAEMVVSAPAPGVIEAMDLRPGDLVGPNQAVATLLESDQLWVRVFVPEPQMGRVHMGQAAEVTVDTFPGRAFPGRVVEIRSQGEYTPRNIQTSDQRSDQVFGVKVRVDPRPELKAGMAAAVRLLPEGVTAAGGRRP